MPDPIRRKSLFAFLFASAPWRAAGALALIAALFALSGCAALAPFNQYSFNETARLKVESRQLLAKAGQPYRQHARKADSVMAGLNRAYQDASIRTKNNESMRRWEILLDTNQASLAGSITRWRREGTLAQDVIEAAQKDIAEDFDLISKLEGNKGK
jgi:hypothetical protein